MIIINLAVWESLGALRGLSIKMRTTGFYGIASAGLKKLMFLTMIYGDSVYAFSFKNVFPEPVAD